MVFLPCIAPKHSTKRHCYRGDGLACIFHVLFTPRPCLPKRRQLAPNRLSKHLERDLTAYPGSVRKPIQIQPIQLASPDCIPRDMRVTICSICNDLIGCSACQAASLVKTQTLVRACAGTSIGPIAVVLQAAAFVIAIWWIVRHTALAIILYCGVAQHKSLSSTGTSGG